MGWCALINAFPGRHLLSIICGLLVMTALDAQWREMQFDDSDMARDLTEALTFQKYPTYDQYVEMMQYFASQYPEICRLDTFGTSAEGRLLLALKISDHVKTDEEEAHFLYTSSMHGDELLGIVLMLRLASDLLTGYGSDSEITALVDSLSIWINPLANPDGSYAADNNLSLEHSTRFTTQGFDLNRNFPDPAIPEPDDTSGRAVENQYMMQFLRVHNFTMSANIHSGTEVVNYPWDFTTILHADDAWYRFISREYADEAMAVDPDYMFGWPEAGITNGAEWLKIYGGRQDYVNYYLEGREVTLELSEDFRLGSDFLEEHWNINRRSLLNYMAQCMYGIRGRITDLENGDPVEALVYIPGHDSAYSAVHSKAGRGDFYRLIKEGVYDVVISAPGYLNDTTFGVTVTDYQATYLDIRLAKDPKTGLSSNQELQEFHIYPNPASGFVIIEPNFVTPGPLDIRFFSAHGQQLLHQSIHYTGHALTLQTETLPRGLYLVRIASGKSFRTMRFILQ